MASRRLSNLADGRSGKGRVVLLVVAFFATLGGLALAFGDNLRSPLSLYRAAQAASPRRAARLYSLLAEKAPSLEDYARVWKAQASMPSWEAVAALHAATRFRPDGPPAYQAHLALARYYARLDSPRAIEAYEAALDLDDTVEVRLELARYLEEQNAPRGAYQQYLALLGHRRPDAFAEMRRTATDPLVVAGDLLERHFCSDVLDILRDDSRCRASCLRASAYRCLDMEGEAEKEAGACSACQGDSGSGGVGSGPAGPAEGPNSPACDDAIGRWSATWDMELEGRIAEAIRVYLEVAECDVYVSDDAAYRAFVLARRQGDLAAEARALALLREMQPSWYAWLATGKLGMEVAPPYPESATNNLLADVLRRAAALEALGREDLAYQELRFAARVSETPEMIARMAQEIGARGRFYSAYALAISFLDDRPYAPLSVWRSAYPRAYAEEVLRWSDQYDLEPELVWAVMRQESAFRPDTASSAGATGLMQLMKENVDDHNIKQGTNYAPGDAFRPEVNIRVGCWHLAEVLAHYDGDVSLALMAYNAGAGNVDVWLQDRASEDEDDWLRFIPYGETREYLSLVSRNLLIYRALDERGE